MTKLEVPKFETVESSLNWRKNCPVCFSRLEIYDHHVFLERDRDCPNDVKLSWIYGESYVSMILGSNKITNYHVHDILNTEISNNLNNLFGASFTIINEDNHIILPINITCTSSSCYNYLVKVDVNLNNRNICASILSDTLYLGKGSITNYYELPMVSFRENNQAFEVKNLILDFSNPQQALSKLKTLMLFS